MSFASPCSAMSLSTLYPRRPHGSQTIASAGPRTSERIGEPSRGMVTALPVLIDHFFALKHTANRVATGR